MSTMTFFGPPPRAGSLDPEQHDEWLRFAVIELYGIRSELTSEVYELITSRPWQRIPQDAPRA